MKTASFLASAILKTNENVDRVCNSIGLLCKKVDDLVDLQKDLIKSLRGKKVPNLLNNKIKKN